MVVVWLALAVVLLFFELHHMAFYALFVAVGFAVAAGVALAAPSAIGAQAGVSVGVSLVGVVAVRPYVSRVFHTRRMGQVARGVHGGLVGQEAMTLDEVGDPHHVGHVRLVGERWLAVSAGPQAIAAGTAVTVLEVRGTTLVVWPLQGEIPSGEERVVNELPEGSVDAPDGADGSTA